MNNGDMPVNAMASASEFQGLSTGDTDNALKTFGGLTKREHFAAMLLQGYVAKYGHDIKLYNCYITSVSDADLLLKALEGEK